MNFEACESFINFCDEMIITNESKTTIEIDRKQAVRVSSVPELISKGQSGAPLIMPTGKLASQIAQAFKQKKLDRNMATADIVIGLTVLWPLLIYGLIQRSNDKEFVWVKDYKLITGSKNYYIIKKGYHFV